MVLTPPFTLDRETQRIVKYGKVAERPKCGNSCIAHSQRQKTEKLHTTPCFSLTVPEEENDKRCHQAGRTNLVKTKGLLLIVPPFFQCVVCGVDDEITIARQDLNKIITECLLNCKAESLPVAIRRTLTFPEQSNATQ